jgi:DNA-binding PadR family transcriptional regulator
MPDDTQRYLPLTETTFYILLALAPEPRHGYSIMKEVEAMSAGRVVLSTGTLYGALKRLLDAGWIERVGEPNGAGGRERKAYALTLAGRRVLQAETTRLGGLVEAARRRRVTGRA